MAKEWIAASLRWEVWERDNFTCRRCGVRRDLSVDHIVPESKGGPTTLSNLQTLCRKCNSSKGAGPRTKGRKPPPPKVGLYVKNGQHTVLKQLALSKGCVVRRGSYAGQGSIGKLLQGIAEGKFTVVRLGQSNEKAG